MKLMRLLAFLAFSAVVALAQNPPPSPKLNTVTPESGKADVEFTAAGENLTKTYVADLYLTDGTNDIKVSITAQEAASIKFKPPAKINPGRYALMLLTADRTRFLEQPVKVTIE